MPSPSVKIDPVRHRKDLRSFIRLPWSIYKGDPNWVPPLLTQVKSLLDQDKHPFYRNADCQLFLARDGDGKGRAVGRVAAVVNRIHNDTYGESTCFFGFFESTNDRSVSDRLFDTVAQWARSRGMSRLRGPMNPSVHYEIGLLTRGFDSPPAVMMTYNPAYYADLVAGYGFRKARDIYAYTRSAVVLPERLARILETMKRKSGVSLRNIDMKNFDSETRKIRDMYNQAWHENWGMIPIDEAEFRHLALEMKQLIDPDFVMFAEVSGRPVGFAVVLPNINEALQKLNGRLFPFGLLKLLWYARKISSVRVLLMGIVPEYRKVRGIAPMLYDRMFELCRKKGFTWGEQSWILEDNVDMIAYLEKLGAERAKTYTIYDLEL